MIQENDCVVLTADLPAEGLVAGDVGMVVHVHAGDVGYEVEFTTVTGRTVAVTTVAASQLRPAGRREERLTPPEAVGVGGVEKRDAEIARAPDRGERIVIAGAPPAERSSARIGNAADGPGAEADLADPEVGFAEGAVMHSGAL